MKILVLGSGAGGGFPQWNCNCEQCSGQRKGHKRALPRTQSSIAVSADGERWVLLNASPDLGEQIRRNPALHPRHGLRHTPLCAVVLMDAQIDHVTGLLSMREGREMDLHCTPAVYEDLTHGLPLLETLRHYCEVRWHELPVAGERRQADFQIEAAPGLRFRAVAIPGAAPPYSPHRRNPTVGDNIALRIEDVRTGCRVLYAPGLARVGEAEMALLRDADCVMVDGTFWSEDEMSAQGLGTKSASDMGHLPQTDVPGRPGMMSALGQTGAQRKVLIHINNSNPILDEDSAQRQELTRRGIEVAFDGMEIEL